VRWAQHGGGTPKVRSLADVAWLEIREQILTGELPPGAPVGLKEQAARLGVSIMPIRDAVKRLQHEGLVVQVPQREAYVAPLSLADMEDVYRVRLALEPMAVEEAARRFSEDDYRRLDAVLDEMVRAYESGEARAGRELHRQFHLELYARAESPLLNRLIPPLLDATERYRVLGTPFRGTPRERGQEHREILQVCVQRDAARARAVLAEHLRRTVADVRRALAEAPARVAEREGR
jgi:DNA-binding GntR family transcriptional regulator